MSQAEGIGYAQVFWQGGMVVRKTRPVNRDDGMRLGRPAHGQPCLGRLGSSHGRLRSHRIAAAMVLVMVLVEVVGEETCVCYDQIWVFKIITLAASEHDSRDRSWVRGGDTRRRLTAQEIELKPSLPHGEDQLPQPSSLLSLVSERPFPKGGRLWAVILP